MDLSKVTLQDCVDLHEKKNKCVTINDGEVVAITSE